MTLEGEDWFSNQYYVNIRRFLTIIGLWPYQESSKRLSYVALITVLFVVGIYSQIYAMLISERKKESIIEILQTLLPTSLFAFAYWNLLYNSAIMKTALEHVKNDWDQLTREDELTIIQTYAEQSKLYSRAIAFLFFCYSIFLTFPSILRLFLYISGTVQQTELILPVHSELFLATKSIYLIAFSLELIITFTACIIGITNYSMFISFVQHACALLIIVRNKIDQPFIKNKYKFCWVQTDSKREPELEWIVAIVKNYDNVINFVELITSLYGKMYIAEVSFGLCFLIIDFIYFFQLLYLVRSAAKTLKICIYLHGTLLVIYAYLHLGERLIEHSTSVYVNCRLVPFYTLSIQTNKLFLLLIIRTMKPCNISVNGTAVASHELLAKMMKVSFSFATVCYNGH